jgi:hypothetical protein
VAGINFQNRQVPAWAGFFRMEEYIRFMECVSDYFNSGNVSYSFKEGAIVNAGMKDSRLEKMGLLNLAQFCRLRPMDEWASMINDHFEGISKAASIEKDFSGRAHDFSCVRDFIGVRVYPEEYVSVLKNGLAVGKQMGDGLYAMLVFDFSECIVNVRPEQTIQWPLGNEELLELGISNTKSKYPLNLSTQDVDGVPIHFVVENHFYAPNILFDLMEEPSAAESKGLLIGMPTRHAALMHRITDWKVLQAIHRMIPAINGMNKDGPGAVSDKLYWLNNSKLTTLPYKLDDQNIHFDPPEDFIALLQELEGDEGYPVAVRT